VYPFGIFMAAFLTALAFTAPGSAGVQAGNPVPPAPQRLAPDPASTSEAVVQVYAARARGLKGLFGVHTWIATKSTGGRGYTVYEVIGWRVYRGNAALVVRDRIPDAPWFGAEPDLLAEKRGPEVQALIGRIDQAARAYPWAGEYRLWPGPNSNTFTAWIARAVPELELDLPPTAIGKDYSGSRLLASAPSGHGFQLSVFGLLGLTASGVEGLEINLLGLTFGLNPIAPTLKLPMIGRIGPSPVPTPVIVPASDNTAF
jgi:hypothetical protein